MSMLRIRYEKHRTREGCKISKNTYTSDATGAKYKVIIDEENMMYMVRNERSKEFTFTSKPYTNMNALKRAARTRLGSLGVPIGIESRDRTFGLCSKNYTQKEHEEEK